MPTVSLKTYFTSEARGTVGLVSGVSGSQVGIFTIIPSNGVRGPSNAVRASKGVRLSNGVRALDSVTVLER